MLRDADMATDIQKNTCHKHRVNVLIAGVDLPEIKASNPSGQGERLDRPAPLLDLGPVNEGSEGILKG